MRIFTFVVVNTWHKKYEFKILIVKILTIFCHFLYVFARKYTNTIP
jgi:hypothetical protein